MNATARALIRLVVLTALCLRALTLHAQTITASAEDVAALKSIISAADAWDAKGKTRFDADLPIRLEQSWRSMRDPLLRIKARELVPALERAAVLRLRLTEIAATTKAAKRIAAFESGAPQWLSDLVGADSLHLLDRLTSVNLFDGQNPHATNLTSATKRSWMPGSIASPTSPISSASISPTPAWKAPGSRSSAR
jgi:hypothetical protein